MKLILVLCLLCLVSATNLRNLQPDWKNQEEAGMEYVDIEVQRFQQCQNQTSQLKAKYNEWKYESIKKHCISFTKRPKDEYTFRVTFISVVRHCLLQYRYTNYAEWAASVFYASCLIQRSV